MISFIERAGGEIIIPLRVPRERVPLPTRIRSTLLASSLRAIRARGLFDQYFDHLEPRWREPILEAVAGVWLPIDAGIAHYEACDSLGLSSFEHLAIGREVGERVHGTVIGTMIRAATSVGVTPWLAFTYVERLYERLFDGGACLVVKTGPKDAQMELVGNPVVRLAYFRNGMRGVWQVALELFCTKGYVIEIGRTDTSYKVKISWV